jgi:hypothetical protein
MKLYAEEHVYRTRQIFQDVALVLWIIVWIRIGMLFHDLFAKLTGPGAVVESAGDSLANTMTDIGREISQLPVVGSTLQAPFDAAAGAAKDLGSAGQTQQDIVLTIALWLGILLALIPIMFVLYKYIPDRYRWVREASAAHRLRIDADDLHLFALRAVATRPLYELRRVHPDPSAALASGDYAPLASLELGALGLKV